MQISSDYVSFVSSFPLPSSTSSLLSTSVSLKVQILTTVPCEEYGYTDITHCYTDLTQALTTAVTSGQFTLTLQSLSNTYNSVNTRNAAATTVSNSDMIAVNSDNNKNSSSDSFPVPALVVIIVVGFVLLGLIFFLMYRRSRGRKDQQQRASRTLNNLYSSPGDSPFGDNDGDDPFSVQISLHRPQQSVVNPPFEPIESDTPFSTSASSNRKIKSQSHNSSALRQSQPKEQQTQLPLRSGGIQQQAEQAVAKKQTGEEWWL
jgi:type II secretory pathway pseudopilin PulG